MNISPLFPTLKVYTAFQNFASAHKVVLLKKQNKVLFIFLCNLYKIHVQKKTSSSRNSSQITRYRHNQPTNHQYIVLSAAFPHYSRHIAARIQQKTLIDISYKNAPLRFRSGDKEDIFVIRPSLAVPINGINRSEAAVQTVRHRHYGTDTDGNKLMFIRRKSDKTVKFLVGSAVHQQHFSLKERQSVHCD